MEGMNAETSQAVARLIDVLADLAPWAGGAVVVAVCFRVMGETPSNLISALAHLLRGRPKSD